MESLRKLNAATDPWMPDLSKLYQDQADVSTIPLSCYWAAGLGDISHQIYEGQVELKLKWTLQHPSNIVKLRPSMQTHTKMWTLSGRIEHSSLKEHCHKYRFWVISKSQIKVEEKWWHGLMTWYVVICNNMLSICLVTYWRFKSSQQHLHIPDMSSSLLDIHTFSRDSSLHQHLSRWEKSTSELLTLLSDQ